MSDDLRERVARAIANVREGGWPADTYALLQQHYLTMADAALAEIGAVRVKPLQWEDFEGQGAKASGFYQANYLITKWRGRGEFEVAMSYPSYQTGFDGERFHPTLEAAKAAAQADYEARILAAIEHAPVSVREAARVLLDAARIEPVHDAIQRSVRPAAFCAALRAIAEGEVDE
jgi:hypothetical protein